MEHSAIGMYLVAPDGVVLAANPALCGFLGRDRAMFVSCRWQELTHPDDVGADADMVADVLGGRIESYRLVKRYLRGDGSVVWGDLSVAGVRDGTGSVMFFVCQVVEVSDQVAARAALAESQAQYRVLAESAADVVLAVDAGARITWVSPAVLTSLGWDPQALSGQPVIDLVHPADRAAARGGGAAGDVEADRTGVGPAGESRRSSRFRMRTKAGGYRWVACVCTGLVGGRGGPSGGVWGLTLVDDLVAERELALGQRAQLQATLDSLLDPHVLLRAVRGDGGQIVDFVFADANEAACQYARIPCEQLLGARLLDLMPGPIGAGLVGLHGGCIDAGKPLVLDDQLLPAQFLGTDRRLDVRGVRVGEYFSFTWRDVTDRHAAAAALARSEAQLRLLVENANDVVVASSPEGVLTWVSDSVTRVLGWEPGELIGQPVAALAHPDDVAPVGEPATGPLVAGEGGPGQAGTAQWRVRTSAGEYRWVQSVTRTVGDAAGTVTGAVSGWRDITSEHTARAALAEAERRYRLVADNVYDVVLRARDGVIGWVSPSLTRELGWEPGDWIGHHLYEFLLPEDKQRLAKDQAQVYAQDASVNRFQIRARDGEYHWVETHTKPVRDEAGSPDGVVSTFRTIDTEVRAELELQRRAKSDELTGALKRDEALAVLTKIADRPRRTPGQHTAVVFCDVDDFKGINDAYGHVVGDLWLTATATRISDAVRGGDIVARMGGDEFLIILQAVHDLAQATTIAEKIRTAVAEPLALQGTQITASMSFGVTLASPDEPVDALIGRSDRAMYKAKRAGRNQVVPILPPTTKQQV